MRCARRSGSSRSFSSRGRLGARRSGCARLGWNYEVGGGPEDPETEEEEEERNASRSGTKLVYGVKLAVSEQRDWRPQSALILQATTPTSGPNNATQYTAGFVAGWTLPNDWSLDGSLRHVAANEEGDKFDQWTPSIVLEVPLGEHWNAHAEYFGIFSDDRADVRPGMLGIII